MENDIYAELDKYYRTHPQQQSPLLLEEVSKHNQFNPIDGDLKLDLWSEVKLLQLQQLIGPGPSLQETVDASWAKLKELAQEFIKSLC